jgi:hypothetical protein
MLRSRVPLCLCVVSIVDVRGIRHVAEVHGEWLYEAVILAIRIFREDPWLERIGPGTVFDVEVREPAARHAITFQEIQQWLDRTSLNASEGLKKAKLKQLLTSC